MIQKRVCDRCGKDFFETYKEWLCRACMNELGWECTPKTNADHIRSMSDEELATTLYSVFGIDDSKIPFCKNKPECDELLDADKEIPEPMCLRCMLAWLNQPLKEDKFGGY